MHISGILKRKRKQLTKFVLLSTGLLLTIQTAYAQGLLVMPRRVVFEGGRRTQELNLANSGMDTTKYTISMIEIKMNEDGTFEEVPAADSGQIPASKHLRIFPRSVILGPNESQTVKVTLMNAGKLSPGEYRSHIYFKAIPKVKPDGAHMKKMVTNLSLKLTPVFGLTIPAIVRIGDYSGGATISDFSFEMPNDSPRVNILFNRTGNMSTYGNITIDYLAEQGKPVTVGMVKGFALYTPNVARKLRLNLDKNDAVNYRTGKLKIEYSNIAGERVISTAEKEITLE